MGIRVEHNYGGAAIGAAYVAGAGKARQRREKYALDLMRENQLLALKRQDMFQERAFRYGMQQQNLGFQQQQNRENRDFALERQKAGFDFSRERDEAGFAFTRERDAAEREFMREREEGAREYELEVEGDAREREGIASGAIDEDTAKDLAEIRDKIRRVEKSTTISDPAKKQQILDRLKRQREELRSKRMPLPTRDDMLRKAIGDKAFEKYGDLPWIIGDDGKAELPPGFKMPQDPEAAAAKSVAERVAKEAEEIAKVTKESESKGSKLYGKSPEELEAEAMRRLREREERAARRTKELGGEVATEAAAPPAEMDRDEVIMRNLDGGMYTPENERRVRQLNAYIEKIRNAKDMSQAMRDSLVDMAYEQIAAIPVLSAPRDMTGADEDADASREAAEDEEDRRRKMPPPQRKPVPQQPQQPQQPQEAQFPEAEMAAAQEVEDSLGADTDIAANAPQILQTAQQKLREIMAGKKSIDELSPEEQARFRAWKDMYEAARGA